METKKPGLQTGMGVVKELLDKAKDKDLKEKKFWEEVESLKADANHCFNSPSGRKIAKFMMKMSGIYNVGKNSTDPALMGEERGLAKMYLLIIKGMCTPDLIAEIERPNEGE